MWVDNKYDVCIGKMRLATEAEYKAISGDVPMGAPIHVYEDGELYTLVEMLYVWEDCYACINFRFNKLECGIEMGIRTMWNRPNIALKLAIKADFDAKSTGQTAFGREEIMEDAVENARLQWTALYNRNQAVCAFTDSGYGVSFDNNTMFLTLLHTPTYCAHAESGVDLVPLDRISPKIDIGMRKINLKFRFGDASLLDSVDALAQAFNEKPYALAFFPSGEGEVPPAGLEISDEKVLVTAFKRTHNQDGYILRIQEPTGNQRTVRLEWKSLNFRATYKLGAFEVKTIKIGDDGSNLEVRLDEFPMGGANFVQKGTDR